jgi:preprotein translocase subunit SecD
MEQSRIRSILFSEIFLWIAFGGVCLYSIYPLRQKIRFGIDLVGGTYLTLEVETKKAIEADLISKLQGIDGILQSARLKLASEKVILGSELQLKFSSALDAQAASSALKKEWRDVSCTVKETSVIVAHSSAARERVEDDAVTRNIEVLRTRLDPLSTSEISIAREGDTRITVELPDVSDPQKAKEMIGRTAKLEFRLVYDTAHTAEDLLYKLEGDLPSNREIVPSSTRVAGKSEQFYLVERYAQVTGNMLKSARPGFGGQMGTEVVVQFEFGPEGADRFYALTSKNHGRRLAIILDGEVISAPTISAAIRDSGQINGNFTPDEARTLALLLQAGSFVAPVKFVEERQVGPTLGETSIRNGVLSCAAGLGLLFLFSIAYYKFSGFLAFLGLLYNLLLLLAGLAWIQATLTLPGIAGIILTIGMAIDGAVLIFEQVREELALGISPKVSLRKGFSDAMTVILDSNITTFIVGVVLYHVGSGPIQGFAVTLMIGIVATLGATLLFLRALFAFITKNFAVQKLSI